MTLRQLQECLAEKRHHVSPFLVLGDPTPEISFQLAAAAVEAWAHVARNCRRVLSVCMGEMLDQYTSTNDDIACAVPRRSRTSL